MRSGSGARRNETVSQHRILLDRDQEAALAFLDRHLRSRLRDVMEGG